MAGAVVREGVRGLSHRGSDVGLLPAVAPGALCGDVLLSLEKEKHQERAALGARHAGGERGEEEDRKGRREKWEGGWRGGREREGKRGAGRKRKRREGGGRSREGGGREREVRRGKRGRGGRGGGRWQGRTREWGGGGGQEGRPKATGVREDASLVGWESNISLA